MKNNRIMWGVVSLVVLITIAVSLGTMTGHSQKDTSKEQEKSPFGDLSKYAVADYDAPVSKDAVEREKRILKNNRYDDQTLVQKNPHPDDTSVKRFDEILPPPIIPSDESDLIVTGEITCANAYLSNDKGGIYTEFTIRVDEILKSDVSNKLNQGDSITADRAGGFVRYPNGQKVLYKIAQKDLLKVGSHYVLFLTMDKQSPNYEILTGHELKGSGVNPLDTERSFDEFKGTSKLNFVEAIRNKIAESTISKEPGRKP